MLFLVFLYSFLPQLVPGASVARLWTKDPFIIVWLNFTLVVNPSQPSFLSLGLAVNKIYDIDPYLANWIIKKKCCIQIPLLNSCLMCRTAVIFPFLLGVEVKVWEKGINLEIKFNMIPWMQL